MPNPKPSPKPFDSLVAQLIDTIPPGMRSLPQELEKKFHQILHAAFLKMDLVTREEFDAQVRVLQRTREKLEALEKKLPQQKSAAKK